jgi:hypothetical protein
MWGQESIRKCNEVGFAERKFSLANMKMRSTLRTDMQAGEAGLSVGRLLPDDQI